MNLLFILYKFIFIYIYLLKIFTLKFNMYSLAILTNSLKLYVIGK